MTKKQLSELALKIYEIQEFAFIPQQSREDSYSELVKLLHSEITGLDFSFKELSFVAIDLYRERHAVSKIDRRQFLIETPGHC